MRYASHDTGLVVGGLRVSREGYESVGICIACRDRSQFAAAEELAAQTDPAEIASRLSSGPPPHLGAPTNIAGDQAWYKAVRKAWSTLAASGAIGGPAHDLLELDVRGRNTRLSFTETSRSAIWWARDAVPFGDAGAFVDLWITDDCSVLGPSAPGYKGTGLLDLERDIKGRVIGPKPLKVVVPRGSQLQTRKQGMYYERKIELVNGVAVKSEYGLHAPYVPLDLAKAVVAVLAAQDGV